MLARPGRCAAVVAMAALLLAAGSPALAADDPTVTRKAKVSEAHRETIGLRAWRQSPHGQDISWRESHDVCRVVSASGEHRGKWQMTRSLWREYGGRTFARSPERASCREQDRVAHRVWVDQWWWPWGG